jgi:ABC-2 type transport system ATP-binding protein
VQEIAGRVGIIRKGVVVETADVQDLVQRSFRRVRIRLRDELKPGFLEGIPGVTILTQNQSSATIQIEGEMDALIKALAKLPVLDLETERPSLEEIFMAYYKED